MPIEVTSEAGERHSVTTDEGIRPDSTLEKLSRLKPAFENDEMNARFPEIDWRITAANSSQVTDGASAMLIAEESVAARLGLEWRAAITYFAVTGDDPIMMLTGIMPATKKLLARAGLSIGDIDAYEVNEAFASVPLAWEKELDTDPDKLNVYGGAIALGHPVGAAGGKSPANPRSARRALRPRHHV